MSSFGNLSTNLLQSVDDELDKRSLLGFGSARGESGGVVDASELGHPDGLAVLGVVVEVLLDTGEVLRGSEMLQNI